MEWNLRQKTDTHGNIAWLFLEFLAVSRNEPLFDVWGKILVWYSTAENTTYFRFFFYFWIDAVICRNFW